MARRTWEDVGGIALEIIRGEHDADLQYIQQACGQRIKRMYRKGQRVKLVGTKNVELDGKIAVITKVNTKTLSITIPDVGEYNVSPALVEAIAPSLVEVSLPEAG
jgi:hypothetical protein